MWEAWRDVIGMFRELPERKRVATPAVSRLRCMQRITDLGADRRTAYRD